MRRDNLRRIQIDSSNLETQPASEMGMGLAQRPGIPQRTLVSTSVLADER